MKPNWRVIIALVVMVAVSLWAVTSVMAHSFSGTNLTFGVGDGTVTVNNPSDAPVAVQLVGKGTRAFTVSSSIEGIAGPSVKQGTGSTSTHLFEYALPPGKSDFSVARGSSVNFVATTDTKLEATVHPLSDTDTRATLLVAGVVVLGGLFYMSQATEHRWLKMLRGQETPVPVIVATPVATSPDDPNRGRDGRMYSNYGGKD